MTEPLNPYAATHSGMALADPIYLVGKLTRVDLMMSLRDAPPTNGFSRLQYPIDAPARRLLLPYRFFSAVEDVREVCDFLCENAAVLVDQPPSDSHLANQISESERSARLDFQQARHCSKDQWPLDSSSQPQFDWVINLDAG